MGFKRSEKDEIVFHISKLIFEIIFDNFESIQNGNFRVRPFKGVNSFYINKVNMKHNNGLKNLIHFILHKELIYYDILSSNQYILCSQLFKNQPYSIYYPEGKTNNDLEIMEILDYIFNYTIFQVGHYMIGLGLDIRFNFKNYLDLFEHKG